MLAAATELLLTLGTAGFTIDEVARRSGVAKTTIYRHFPSGMKLLIAALDSTIAPFGTPDTGSLRDDLCEFVSQCLPTFTDPAVRPLMLDILAKASRHPELHKLHQAMVKERMGPLRTIFERAQARGEIGPDLAFEEACDLIEGPFIARWLLRPDTLEEGYEATIDRIVLSLQD